MVARSWETLLLLQEWEEETTNPRLLGGKPCKSWMHRVFG